MADLKTRRSLALQRIRENHFVIHTVLVFLALWGFALALVQNREKAVAVLSQVHRSARLVWLRKVVEPYISRNRTVFYHTMTRPTKADIELAGKRLLVLKPPLPNGEKGILLVMFSDTLHVVYSCMDLRTLLRDYTLVFEPSYPGYCHSGLLQYTRFPDKMFVLSPVPGDFALLQRLRSNLVPVDLGPCDWVDPRVAEPYIDNPKEFDIVMNAIWASLKRHFVLFRMLANAKRRYNVALIGVPWEGRERADIEREAKYYGVRDQLTIFECIPYTEVMDVTCKSRTSVLLSLKEAGNRAIAESIFCNVPVIILTKLVGGIVKNVVPDTGMRVEEPELESAVEHLLKANIGPRKWGVEHISCLKSSDRLNNILRGHAALEGRPWSVDIAARSNSPECRYVFEADAYRLRRYNEGLKDYYVRC